MKAFLFVFLGWSIICGFRCPDITDGSKSGGRITVYVHWGETPIAGKKVELVETGAVQWTGEEGRMEFSVRSGRYTVRVYDINRGGPSYQQIDFEIDVKPSATALVDVVDCLPCV